MPGLGEGMLFEQVCVKALFKILMIALALRPRHNAVYLSQKSACNRSLALFLLKLIALGRGMPRSDRSECIHLIIKEKMLLIPGRGMPRPNAVYLRVDYSKGQQR